jgi:hypothetical protein
MADSTSRKLEVADILRAHGDAYRERRPVSPEQAKAMRSITACRTAALGGHVDACAECGFHRISYNSCRDRHCPKCQATKRAAWLETRLERLLPVDHFHVVFTLPDQLQPLVLKNQRLLYNLLFRAASQTLLTLAADPKRLGAQPGITAVLHTWGQNLLFHPHLHCVVTGGGLSADGQRWVPARQGYLLPVKVLAKLFRGKFLAGVQQAYNRGELKLKGSIASLAHPRAFRNLLTTLYQRNWIVYAKAPFGGAEQVYRYLGRYTHGVAISNSRLLSHREGRVQFRYKDYADASQQKVMSLTVEEFIRRFLLHILPKGFVRIRHYGLLASRNVSTRLANCRGLLTGQVPPAADSPKKTWVERILEWFGLDVIHCPRCGGNLERESYSRRDAHRPVADRPVADPRAHFAAAAPYLDSS